MYGQAHLDPETKEVIPVSWEEYLQWKKKESDKDAHVVKQTYLRHYWVSTVFLGLAHNGGTTWFETYIFKVKGKKGEKEIISWSEVYGRRFATYAEALANHEEILAYYKANKTVPRYLNSNEG